MASFNKVLLMGNLTRDPELRYLPSGTAVVEFGLAMSRTWTDQKTGERRESPTFVDCKAMGRPAEVINQYMTKGRSIFIEGRLEYRTWEAKDGSGKRSKLDVFVENFQFTGGRRDDAPGGGGPGGPPTRERQAYGDPRTGQHAQAAEMGAGPAQDAAHLQDDDVPF